VIVTLPLLPPPLRGRVGERGRTVNRCKNQKKRKKIKEEKIKKEEE
jgi:hypothetical protein